MPLRDTLAARPAVANALTAGVIVAALAFIAVDVWRPHPAVAIGQTIYFTVDDGQTYFPGPADRLPPFTENGKTAVRAYVFACASGRRFVAYLERLTPQAVAKLSVDGPQPVDRELIIADGTEIKRRGDADWVRRASDAGERILAVQCPPNDTGDPTLKLPGD